MPKVSTLILVVEVPRPFLYNSQKAVPWDYNCNYTNQTAATNLTGVGGITRKGHYYTPNMAKKVAPERFLMPTSKEQPSREKKDKKALEGTSKLVTEKEVSEFFKFITHSEYSVIE